MPKYTHLTQADRYLIQQGLDDRLTFKAIADQIGKDPSTISKEVRNHLAFEKKGAYGRPFNDCLHRRSCDIYGLCSPCSSGKTHPKCSACGKCIPLCINYEKESCSRLLKKPYVCNACPERNKCTLEKCFYLAPSAHNEYREVLSEARQGFALTDTEIKRLDSLISPLLRKGQSLHHICQNHKDQLMVSERSLYTYTNHCLFGARNIDMPRTVRMSPRRKRPDTVLVDTKCRQGRTFSDFQDYLFLHPDTPVVQIDSVEGTKGGPVLLTITFVGCGLQLAYKRQSNDAASVCEIFERLYWELRSDRFLELFPLLLADNGSEFSDPTRIEYDAQGNQRCHLFYCNPSAPYQKGSCEVHHEMIRRLIPKGTDISLFSQDQISLMMNHINSYARKTLGGKSPYEMFVFQYGEEVAEKLGLKKILPDEIVLSPKLFL